MCLSTRVVFWKGSSRCHTPKLGWMIVSSVKVVDLWWLAKWDSLLLHVSSIVDPVIGTRQCLIATPRGAASRFVDQPGHMHMILGSYVSQMRMFVSVVMIWPLGANSCNMHHVICIFYEYRCVNDTEWCYSTNNRPSGTGVVCGLLVQPFDVRLV